MPDDSQDAGASELATVRVQVARCPRGQNGGQGKEDSVLTKTATARAQITRAAARVLKCASATPSG